MISPDGGARRRAPVQPRCPTRLEVVLVSVSLTIVIALIGSQLPGSNGRTAVWCVAVNLVWLLTSIYWSADRPMGRLLIAAGVFGVVELLADFLCVRSTGTLDYSPASSGMVLESPWWMPLLWLIVAVQVSVVGETAIQHFGLLRGVAAGGALGATLIPVYEQLAHGANWWQYRGCFQIGHVPVYIVVTEAMIGAGLSVFAYRGLRVCTCQAAGALGLVGGSVTILAGIVGWGAVEFICHGARPRWILH